jgi:hypothetical protein
LQSNERLFAYQAAVRFNTIVEPLLKKIARHSPGHARQLRRDSIEDNTAEGGTATTAGRKAYLLRI